MKNSQSSRNNIAGQSNGAMRKSQKHDANLQKNSTLYFQIGLILCLLASYAILEMRFENTSITIDEIALNDLDTEIIVPPFTVEPDVVVKKKVEVKTQKLADKPPVIVDNDHQMVDNPIDIVKPEIADTPMAISDIGDIEKPVEDPFDNNAIFDLRGVERVPIYPGCEKATNNKERIKCMSDKMGKLIQRKFNTSVASNLGVEGIQRIDVQFKIDKEGRITDIKTRSPFDLLEREAERVVNKIPQMTPGMQREEPVTVMYYLPIKFQVR